MTRYTPGSTAAALRAGRVTIAEAAKLSGLSYAEVHRRCREGQIASATQADDGTWSLRRSDALALTRREPADPDRVALSQIRVHRARYEAWAAEAARRGLSVKELAMRLLDEASGDV